MLIRPLAHQIVPSHRRGLGQQGQTSRLAVGARRQSRPVASPLRGAPAPCSRATPLVLAGLALVAGVTLVPGGLTPAGLVAAALSGALSFGLGYLFYLGGLRHLPASRAAAVVYLVPVFGVASASLLGERLSPVQWLGALVVTVAVGAISVRRIGAAAATA